MTKYVIRKSSGLDVLLHGENELFCCNYCHEVLCLVHNDNLLQLETKVNYIGKMVQVFKLFIIQYEERKKNEERVNELTGGMAISVFQHWSHSVLNYGPSLDFCCLEAFEQWFVEKDFWRNIE